MEIQIKPWGNSQGIRLPKDIMVEAGLNVHDTLSVSVINGQIILSKPFRHRSLKERMNANSGIIYTDTEIDYGDPVEGELW